MKRNGFITYLLIAGLALLPISGCQKQSKIDEQLQPASTQAQEQTIVMMDSNQPGPKIKFDKVVLDFGEVGPGTKSTDEFKFTNIGEEELKITKVGQCCGVVTALEKNEYAPGESGMLKVTYNAPAGIGPQMRQLVVSSNDTTNPGVRLTIKANIVPKIECKPTRLKLFLDEENAGCDTLTVRSLDDQPFAITGFKSTADCITADFDPAIKAKEFVLHLEVDMEKIQKNQKGSIDITLTHPESSIAYVPFDVLPKFTINPPLLIVFNAEPQKPIMRKVWILNNYKEDFEIASTTSKNNIIKVLSQTKVPNGYQFEVEITPPDQKDQLRFTDTFNIEIKGGETKTLVCNGYYTRSKTNPPKK
jgi:hypothetical protein